jgi:predicted dehydrogenase
MRGLILGSGMYVTGRGLEGPGTLLAALVECSRRHRIESLTVAARSADGGDDVRRCLAQLTDIAGNAPAIDYHATGEADLISSIVRLCEQQRYDFAVLCLPDHLHFEGLKSLIALGIPTLVVKPLVATAAEADALIALQRQHRVYCAVEFHKRWDESNLFARKLIELGRLGELSYVGVDYSQRINIPADAFTSWAARSSIFQYLGVHYVDLIHYLTGALPIRLSAYGTRGVLLGKGVDTWDSIHCTIEWQHPHWTRPFASVLNTGWIDPDTSTAMSDQRIYFVGSHGRLDCDQKHRGVEWVEQGKSPQQVNPYFSQLLPGIGGSRYRGYALDSVERFIADVAGLRDGSLDLAALEASDRPTLASARVSTAVTECAHLSLSENNRWVPVHAHP